MLTIYNSLTKRKEAFKPREENKVALYVCGMTVYDYCHLGHGRIFVVYDAWVRFLRWMGYQVTYVRNITDVDDKIIKRAQENNEAPHVLTERFIAAMHEDEDALGVLRPTHEPRATQYIAEMIAMIEILQAKNYAYAAGNGDICFDVHRFQGYGKLSHRNLTELQAGARIEIDETKRSPLDFVLWKLAKANEPSWESPWGKGRPGWHIECSAMSTTLLGQAFDIHGGGVDLKFPHHENEIAQAEGACEHQFVNLWMHVGHIQTGSEKMSKSLNNFLTIRDALTQFPAEVIRYFMLAGHYRSPISYTQDNLNQASQALARLYNALRGLPVDDAAGGAYREKFKATLADDFNTPEALAVLFELAREINRTREADNIEHASALAAELRELGSVLGLLQQDPDQFLQGGNEVDAAKIEALLVERQLARQQKDWAKADSIRQQLDEMNIVIEDSAQGPLWRKR